MRVELAARG